MLKKKVLVLVMALVLLFPTLAFAQDGAAGGLFERLLKSNPAQGVQNQEKIVLIVEVEGEPVALAKNARSFSARAQENLQQQIMEEQAQVQQEIQAVVETPVEPEQVYTNVLNGFSIKVNSLDDMEKIEALPGVKSVSVSRTYKLPEITPGDEELTAQQRLVSSRGLIGADKLAAIGYQGEGQVVAVIDAGLDVDHAFFSQEPVNPKYSKEDMAQLLEQKGMHFQGGVDEVYKSAKIPFAYDYVNNSSDVYNASEVHGTHVSGIVTGKGGTSTALQNSFSGVAPEAQLVFMNVFEEAGARTPIIIQAIDDAAKLGVSAINLSLGVDYLVSVDDSLEEKAIENAKQAGIFVACAAGNAALGYQQAVPITENIEYSSAGTPPGYSATTAVAAAANSTAMLNKFVLADGTEVLFTEGSGAIAFATSFSDKQYPYVYAGYGTAEEFADLQANGVDLSDKIVLVKQHGPEGMMSGEKFANAEAAGAAGCILWYTDPPVYSVSVAASTIPTCIIQNDMGEKMSAAGSGWLQANPDVASVPIAGEDKLSAATSWGTGETLELKPEIMAPGDNIYSSIPSATHDQYKSVSGTSMAAPHITGAVALLNQWYDDPGNALAPESGNRADYFENLMMSTSTIVKQGNGVPYSPRRQSAGLLNLENAVKSPVILVGDDGKTKLSLGDKLTNSFGLSFQVKNTSSDTMATYDQTHLYVMTDGYVERDGQTYVDGTVLLQDYVGGLSLTIRPNKTEDIVYGISIDQAKLDENMAHFPNGFYIDGYLELSDSTGNVPPVHIPFMGFYGNWLQAPLFDGSYYSGDYFAQGTRLCSDLETDRWVYLGQNILSDALPEKEHIAFSPNGDGVFDQLAVNGCLLRGASQLTWELKDSADQVVATAKDENVSKFWLRSEQYGPLVFDLPAELPDGNYTVTGSGYHYSDQDKMHAYTTEEAIPVVVDTQTPEIVAAEIVTENSKTLAKISLADNYCLQVVGLTAENQKEDEAWQQVVDGTTDSVTFDITGFNPKMLTIGAADYALNQIAVPLTGVLTATVQNISLQGFTVVFEQAVALDSGNFILQKDGEEIKLSSVEKVNDTTYRVSASLGYDTQYTLLVKAGDTQLAAISFTTQKRPSSGGSHGGGTVVTDPSKPEDGQKEEEKSENQSIIATPVFNDVSSADWYYTAVTEMARQGVIWGKDDGTFGPNESIKRADFLVLVMRAAGIQPDVAAVNNFADAGNTYYTGYLAKAKAQGYVDGTGDGKFRPQESITRQDMLVMLYRILEAEEKLPPNAGGPQTFTDSAAIAPYAREAVQTLSAAGIIKGFGGLFNPNSNTLRSEAAQVLYSIFH